MWLEINFRVAVVLWLSGLHGALPQRGKMTNQGVTEEWWFLLMIPTTDSGPRNRYQVFFGRNILVGTNWTGGLQRVLIFTFVLSGLDGSAPCRRVLQGPQSQEWQCCGPVKGLNGRGPGTHVKNGGGVSNRDRHWPPGPANHGSGGAGVPMGGRGVGPGPGDLLPGGCAVSLVWHRKQGQQNKQKTSLERRQK